MERLELTAAPGDSGRLDAWLAGQCPTLSRSALQNLIEQGLVTCGGVPVNKKDKVAPGKIYAIDLPDPQPIEARPPATRTARSSTRCFITARGSCRASAGPSARASSTALTRTRAAFSSLPKTMPPIRRSAPR